MHVGDVSPKGSVEERERNRFALDAAEVGVWDYYPQTDELIWDARAKAIHELSPEEAVTYERFIESVHPLDRPRVAAHVATTVSPAGPADYELEYRIVTLKGHERWIHVKGAVIARDASGLATRFIGTVLDISERKRLEQEREMFLGIVGHDLRNPLSAVVAGAHLLGVGAPLTPAQQRVVERISASAGRMTRIIDDLLDFARGHLGGGIPILPAPEDMGTLCLHVVDELTTAHPDRQLRLAVAGCLAGKWDRQRVMQALSNLVGNAIVHGRGPIEIGARGDETAVEVTVANGGEPIPREVQAVIFEPFRRTPDTNGLGLGLYITAEIVRAHGGTIRVASDARATTFTTVWPR